MILIMIFYIKAPEELLFMVKIIFTHPNINYAIA